MGAAETNSPEARQSVRTNPKQDENNSSTTGATNQGATSNNTTDVKK
ncbi:hypothetical protein GCM10023259_103660 [Thermocatellispora tengchongensis]